MIAIVADSRSLSEFGPLVLETWAKHKHSQENEFDIRFFVGSDAVDIPEAVKPYTIQVKSRDEYPPRKKVFEMWNYLHDVYIDEYGLFLKVDMDSFVNVDVLKKVSRFLLHSPFDRKPIYAGSGATGIPEERPKLGLHAPFCQGMGYFINRAMLRKLKLKLRECLENPFSKHSDTEIGRCVYMASNQGCQTLYVDTYVENDLESNDGPCVPVNSSALTRFSWRENQRLRAFRHIRYSINSEGFVTNIRSAANGQSYSNHEHYFSDTTYSLLVHPIKSRKEYRRLDERISRNLKPIIPQLKFDDDMSFRSRNGIESSRQHDSCVHNPLLQQLMFKDQLRECPSVGFKYNVELEHIPAFVLNLDHRMDRYQKIKEFFDHTSIKLRRFSAVDGSSIYTDSQDLPMITTFGNNRRMTPGEMGLRDTMRNLFQNAIERDFQMIMVLEDDAVPHCDFDNMLRELLSDLRCGGHLYTENKGGVLQLGASVWNEHSWHKIDNDMYSHYGYTLKKQQKCFNSFKSVTGAFAVLYHRNVFETILRWLDEGPPEPWDWVFGQITAKGFISRVANPFLVIPDTRIVSDIDDNRGPLQHDMAARSEIHRWDLKSFPSFCEDCACGSLRSKKKSSSTSSIFDLFGVFSLNGQNKF